MNKTIQINPELFKINFSGTRKKKASNKELKVKPNNNSQKDNNTTLAKRKNILKFIRRHQDNNVNEKEKFDNKEPNTSDFDESMKYLMDMTDQFGEKTVDPISSTLIPSTSRSSIVSADAPKYGCMKHGGSLPTYRQYHVNQTKKNTESELPSLGIPNVNETSHVNETPTVNKKTLTRTFRIGKSLKDQKISVLVSNKTLRKEISNTDIALKQTSMTDVRRYLVKHGLVKIGTSCPPDVLRQMYESASLMCGDVINHNSETLMYNFLNANTKE